MKKYAILISSSILLLAIIFFSGNYIDGQTVSANTFTVEPVSVTDTVTCSGTIVQANAENQTDYRDYISVYNTIINAKKSTHDSESGVNPGEMYVVLEASQSQALSLNEGQEVKITGSGLGDIEYTGTITSVDNTATQKISISNTKTVVEAVVNVDFKDDTTVRSGYTVKAVVNTGTETDILLVPYEAVKAEADGREYVLKLVDGVAVKTYVTSGEDKASGLQILDGLSPNDEIILDENVNEGQKVEINDK